MQGIAADWWLIYREWRGKANSVEGWICNEKDVNISDTGSGSYFVQRQCAGLKILDLYGLSLSETKQARKINRYLES